jgi:hypothetical protein
MAGWDSSCKQADKTRTTSTKVSSSRLYTKPSSVHQRGVFRPHPRLNKALNTASHITQGASSSVRRQDSKNGFHFPGKLIRGLRLTSGLEGWMNTINSSLRETERTGQGSSEFSVMTKMSSLEYFSRSLPPMRSKSQAELVEMHSCSVVANILRKDNRIETRSITLQPMYTLLLPLHCC